MNNQFLVVNPHATGLKMQKCQPETDVYTHYFRL